MIAYIDKNTQELKLYICIFIQKIFLYEITFFLSPVIFHARRSTHTCPHTRSCAFIDSCVQMVLTASWILLLPVGVRSFLENTVNVVIMKGVTCDSPENHPSGGPHSFSLFEAGPKKKKSGYKLLSRGLGSCGRKSAVGKVGKEKSNNPRHQL